MIHEGIKLYLVEDDPTTQDRLSAVLRRMGYEVVGFTDNAKEALTDIQHLHPNLLLLDIHLGENQPTGIDLVRQIRHFSDVPIIFLTVYQRKDYAQFARFLGAHTYMTKPFREFDLKNAIDFALEDHRRKNLEKQQTPITKQDLFVLTADHAYKKLLVKDIAYVQAQGSSVDIHTLDGKKYTQSCSLKSFEAQTEATQPALLRIHRSYLVNVDSIESLSRSFQISLANGISLPVGKKFHGKVKELLNIIWAD